jgi:hypothetical protein
MDGLKKFLEESPMASAVTLPATVIVHRQKLSPASVGRIMEQGSFAPAGEEVCELEVGGKLIARGKIIRRGGASWFKVTEMAKGEEA